MNEGLSKLRSWFLSLFYPERCLLCSVEQEAALCALCRKALQEPNGHCLRCHGPLNEGHGCTVCGADLGCEELYIAADYTSIRKLVVSMKRDRVRTLDWTSLLFTEFVKPECWTLIPSMYHTPWMEECLPTTCSLRTTLTAPLVRHPQKMSQKGYQGSQRQANALDLFAASDDAAPKSHRIHLVDDVMSTGKSAISCIKALRKIGYTVSTVRVLGYQNHRNQFGNEEDNHVSKKEGSGY